MVDTLRRDKFANDQSMLLNDTSPEGTGQGWSNIEPCLKESYMRIMNDDAVKVK